MMPFPDGPTGTENATLLFAAAAAILYFFAVDAPRTPRRAAVKTASVGLLALLAWLVGGPLLLVGALALSALGDAFLAFDGERMFLGGLGSFLVAHLAYAALFLTIGDPANLSGVRIAVGAAMAAGVLAMIFRLWPAAGKSMQVPVACYGAAILAMGLTALTVAQPMVGVGAGLFMVSDALLGAHRFLLKADSPLRPAFSRGVWALYWIGQATITLALVT